VHFEEAVKARKQFLWKNRGGLTLAESEECSKQLKKQRQKKQLNVLASVDYSGLFIRINYRDDQRFMM